MTNDVRPISESISYLLAKVGIGHGYRAGKLLSEVGLYLGQEMVLQFLWQEDRLTQSQLANKIGVQIQTVHKMVQRMEKVDLISKQTDEQDRRVSRICLTQKGRDMQTITENAWDQLEQDTLANFTVEERYIFRRLLNKILENFE